MINSSYSLVQLLLFSGIGIILFLVSTLIGLFLFNLKLDNHLKSYVGNSFLGVVTLISIYSICFVGIKTVNIVALLVLIYLVISNPLKFKLPDIHWREFLPLLYIF